jgi:hypothetical protein
MLEDKGDLMDFAEDEVITAAIALLNANTDLAAAVTGIFDANSIPTNQSFPYVVSGETTGSMLDTFTKNGMNITVAFHVWSRYGGKKQLNKVRSLIYQTLHGATLSMADYTATLTLDAGNAMADNSTSIELWHGTDRYRAKAT